MIDYNWSITHKISQQSDKYDAINIKEPAILARLKYKEALN